MLPPSDRLCLDVRLGDVSKGGRRTVYGIQKILCDSQQTSKTVGAELPAGGRAPSGPGGLAGRHYLSP